MPPQCLLRGACLVLHIQEKMVLVAADHAVACQGEVPSGQHRSGVSSSKGRQSFQVRDQFQGEIRQRDVSIYLD